MLSRFLIVSLAVLVPAPMAMAHYDIRPRVEDGRIVTDGFDDALGSTEPHLRVFGYDFAENPDDPFFAQDPGFNSPAGSGLPVGSQLRFDILGPLQYWSGVGAVSFASVSGGQTLELNFGTATRTITGSSTFQSGFAIQTVGAGGTVHRHLNSFLNGPDGNSVPAGSGSWGAGDGVEAAAGAYLFSIELQIDPDNGIVSSEPIYIVFNHGLSETAHAAAIEWVQNVLVPEPATVGMLLLPLTWLMCRGRKRERNR
ncbi:hypothetical protein [Fontivita pretiosa]|uniref:hypothetical protein n=1 Tax=Fontivita pretiosa TaxID=2989684 RepID=UPI003D1781B6